MLSDEAMIIIIFAAIILIPTIVVFIVLGISKNSRKRKKNNYMGIAQGRVIRIVDKGLDYPWVIHVQYKVNGIDYEIKETAKMRSTAIKVAGIPVGQRKTFVLGVVKEGDLLEIRYDEAHPERAVIYHNDGVVTG
ncbi:MAG: hypothetical protein KHZ73_00885 [Lachnospiraceae bacterium]|nr:hypothetical protein [Lachnospiraceae bacterium]